MTETQPTYDTSAWGGDCNRCALRHSAAQVVWGHGDLTAKIMLIGEGPGFEEDRRGQPFIGRSGKLLDNCLFQAGLRREDIFVTNRVRCRPPQNRKPLPIEVETCDQWTHYELEVVNPAVVVLMGNTAIQLAWPGQRIGLVEGRGRAMTNSHGITQTFIATYHPAAALRDGSGGPLTDKIINALNFAREVAYV